VLTAPDGWPIWTSPVRPGREHDPTCLRTHAELLPALAGTLRSTNAIESMISISRTHSANVKRWRDGQMALRWCAAGMVEAGKQFRRVNGHLHLAKLRTALDAEIAGTVIPAVQDEQVVAA
jgi:putative transposase